MFNKFGLYICMAFFVCVVLLVLLIAYGDFKPLTPEQQTERQKQKNASIMAIFEDSVFVKDPITGECVEMFLKGENGDPKKINRLIAFRTCNCEKIPPEILITAENSKTP